jgi:hypothetical protein
MSSLHLNLDELNGRHERSETNRKKVYDEILRRCHNKIKKYNHELKKQECLFEPPPFIMGKPPYNYTDLCNYVIGSLRNNGLRAEWLPQRGAIYISWRQNDINRKNYENHRPEPITYEDEFEEQLQFMTVAPKRQSSAQKSSGRKKKNDKPIIQHVAMIEYNDHAKDLIPVNPRALNRGK